MEIQPVDHNEEITTHLSSGQRPVGGEAVEAQCSLVVNPVWAGCSFVLLRWAVGKLSKFPVYSLSPERPEGKWYPLHRPGEESEA